LKLASALKLAEDALRLSLAWLEKLINEVDMTADENEKIHGDWDKIFEAIWVIRKLIGA
jgi:hypothetical protein